MMNKTKLVLGIATATLTVAGAMVSQQAVAASKAQHHANEAALMSKVDVLEAQLRAMQDEMAGIRAATGQGADAAKVQELDAWMQESKAKPAHEEHHDNTLFFRGGYAHQNNDRGGTLDPTSLTLPGGTLSNPDGITTGPIADSDAWYFGAGFDFGLTDDVWGMMDDTQVLAELMFDYTELGTRGTNGLSAQETGVVNSVLNSVNGTSGTVYIPAANSETATVNMLRLAASPKIKFLQGSAFRPWLIPIGFELSVISPPSDAITVLTPGMMFGTGADYRIWKDIFIGADVRYHYAPGTVDGVDVNGLTAGGYLGIGF